jgi:hypothetical protein
MHRQTRAYILAVSQDESTMVSLETSAVRVRYPAYSPGPKVLTPLRIDSGN